MAMLNEYSERLVSKAEKALQYAVDAVHMDQSTTRVYVASKGITDKDALFHGMNNMCPLVYLKDSYIRYVDPQSKSARNVSGPISVAYVTMVMQAGTSFVNFSEKLYKGEDILEIDVARLHELDNKILPEYEIKYGNCRVVYATEFMLNNTWLGAIVLEVASVNKIHKPATLLGKFEGKVVASHNFVTGQAK